MSAASDTLESAIAALLVNNTTFAGLGDATGVTGSTAAGSLYVSLHTADPGEAGTQSTSEATYTGYARVAVPRSAAGWTVTGGSFTNAAVTQFQSCTNDPLEGVIDTVTHIGIGTAASGAGKLLLSSAFVNPPSLAVSSGIAPQFEAGVINGSVS